MDISCTRCGLRKPEEFFPEDARKRNGRGSHCRACQSDRHRQWYAKNRAKVAQGTHRTPIPKVCWRCKVLLEPSAFGVCRSNVDGLNSKCLACARADAKHIWNPKAKSSRGNHLWSKYGLTREQITRMLDMQQHSCAICAVNFYESPHGKPHVDHCHRTLRVRALLCGRCNSMLGGIENAEFLAKAQAYLQKHGS